MVKDQQQAWLPKLTSKHIFHAAIALQCFKYWEKIFFHCIEMNLLRRLRASGSHCVVSPWIKIPCNQAAPPACQVKSVHQMSRRQLSRRWGARHTMPARKHHSISSEHEARR